MLVSLEGIQGSGKTTVAIALAYEEHIRIDRRVISNQPLEFDYQPFSIEWFLEHVSDHELEDCILVLDGIGGKVHHVELQKFYLAKKTRPGKRRRYIPFIRQKTRNGNTHQCHAECSTNHN